MLLAGQTVYFRSVLLKLSNDRLLRRHLSRSAAADHGRHLPSTVNHRPLWPVEEETLFSTHAEQQPLIGCSKRWRRRVNVEDIVFTKDGLRRVRVPTFHQRLQNGKPILCLYIPQRAELLPFGEHTAAGDWYPMLQLFSMRAPKYA